MATVTLYSRRTCGLCDEARAEIEALRSEIPFELDEVLIDGRDDLERAYGIRVPVVLVDGAEAFEIHVDREELRALVARSSGA
ncbi:MAG TPA: glutaredoxin family protein [Actinomycetota bacterium]|nr:glutaredoxin family protein [Actinomycetota bacterium]